MSERDVRTHFSVPSDKQDMMRQVGAQRVAVAWPLFVEFVASWIENVDFSEMTAEEVAYCWREDMA